MERWLNCGPVQRRGGGNRLYSLASLDCRLNRIDFQVGLAAPTCVALDTLPCSPVTIDFPGIYSLVLWCLETISYLQRSLFLPFYHWEIEHWPKKRKCGEPFRVLSYKHRPMQTLIRGKSHPGSPLSSALISSVEQCSLTLQAELYFGKSVLIKAHSHERRTCLTDQPVTDRIWLTAGARQTLYFEQNKLDYWIKQQRNEHLNIIYIYLYDLLQPVNNSHLFYCRF